jgi:hypothetical protein
LRSTGFEADLIAPIVDANGWSASFWPMSSSSPGDDWDPRVRAAMANVIQDAAAAEAIRAFNERDISSLVLKGPTLRDWYPSDAARRYVDVDLWVAPEEHAAASEALVALGFEVGIDEQGLPDWWQQHATSWSRGADGAKIDLHRYLQGVPATPEAVWSLLWAQREPFRVAGQETYRLSAPARALHVALHCAYHGHDASGAVRHLEAVLEAVDTATWEDAAALAAQLGAVDAFVSGIRLLPAGRQLAEALALPPSRSVYLALQPAHAPLLALGFERVASARGLRRLEILLRAVVPPPGFVRFWWPPAARNLPMLVLGYLYRPFWLMRRAPRGLRAWLAARREVRSAGR